MAVNWNDFTPIEPQKAKSKAVDWSQFEPITEPTAEERANVRRGLNPDGTRLLPGAGSERTQARLQADSRPVTDEMVPTEVLEPRGAGTYIADRLVASGKTSLKGLGGLVKQANVDYGTGLGAADLAVGVGANILGRLGSDSAKELSNKLNAQAKPISDYGTSVADTLDSYVQDAEDYASPQEKAGDRALSEAKGVLGKLAYVAKNPSVIPEQFLNSIGYMAAGAYAGGAAAGLGAGAAVGANLGTQALLSASSSADGARDIIDQLPDEEIAQFPEYQELLNEYDAPTARKILRQRAGDQSFATGIIANAALFGLTAKLPTLERIMHGETGSSASRSINAMRTLLGEAGQEGLQGGAEQFATNVGTSSADNRVGLLDDVPEAAFMEAITTAPAAVTAGAVQPVAQRRKAEELKALREVAETPEQVGTLDAGIALAEARAGQAEKKGYYAQKRAENAAKSAEESENVNVNGTADTGSGTNQAVGAVGEMAGTSPDLQVNRQADQGAQTQDAIDEAELDRLLTGAFPDSVEQDVSQTDVDGQDAPILASRNDEDVPDANGIEAEELSDAEAERQWIEATEGKSDTLTEGMRALAKNPKLFQTPLYKGQSASDVVSNMPEGFSYGGSELSNDSMTGESALATKVDVTQRFTNDDGSERVEVHPAYIYESPTRTWIEISELKPGGGGADQVYSAAHSLALNTGKKFKEDPDGLSEMAIIARPKHEASGIMKADSSRAIETGPFLARDSSQFGGTKNRPVALNPNPRVNDDLRERLLTMQANATLAVPEVKGIRYDVDSNQFRRGDGSVVTDSDFRGLARTRRANPVREAMVRDRKNPEDKYASPIGHDSLKVAALIETLRTTTDPGARSDLVAKLRVLAETSADLGILSGILPSRRSESESAGNDGQGNRRGVLADTAKDDRAGTQGESAGTSNDGNDQRRASGGLAPTKDQVRDNLTKRYGRRVKRLLDSGRTKIVQSRDEIPANIQAQLKAVDSVGSGTIQGFYHSATGNTYIIADTIKNLDEVGPLLLHEEGVHAGMKGMLGDKFPSIARRLKSIAKSGTEAEKSIVQKAQKRVDRAGTPEQHADEELVAYTVQLAEAAALPSGRLKQWLDDVYAAIKLWAANKGLVNLSVNDIRLIARGALGHRARLEAKDPGVSVRALQSKREAEKTLVIQHNLSANKLIHADKIGGLAVPSLAITKADAPATGFGEITMLGNREMADPKGYAKPKVFGADIYSPRYPTVTLEFTKEMRERGNRMLKDGMDATNEDYINWSDISDSRKVASLSPFIWKFLTENGVTPDIVIVKPKQIATELMPFVESDMDGYDLAQDASFAQAAWNAGSDTRRLLGDDSEASERAQKSATMDAARQVTEYRKAVRGQGKVDIGKTYVALRDQVRNSGLESSLESAADEFIAALGPNEKIFQGHTNSGRKRFIPHTLESVVKILKKDLRGGENFNYGAGSLRAKFTPQFKSIKDIKDNEHRLMSEKEFDAVKEEINTELFALGDTLKPFYRYNDNQFRFMDTLISTIEDIAKIGMSRALSENKFENVSSEAIADVRAFMEKLRNLPTAYFEAKILRDVSLSEFKAAVIPDDASGKVRSILEKSGVSVREYKAGDEADRARVIKESGEASDLIFSRTDKDTITVDGKERSRLNSDGKPIAGDDEALTNFWRWFWESKVVDEQGRPKVVYHGTKAGEFERFDSAKSGSASKFAMFGKGFYFHTNEKSARLYGNNVMPVYIKAENPLNVTMGWANQSGDQAKADAAFSDGHDAIVMDEVATDQIFVKNPSQIKSADKNVGTFSPSDDSILASMVVRTTEQEEALEKAGMPVDNRNLAQRLRDKVKDQWGEVRELAAGNIKQRVFDRFDRMRAIEQNLGVKPEDSAYLSARLAVGLPSIMESIMLYGAPEWQNGILGQKQGTVGLLDALKPIAGDIDGWLGWMVGRRAQVLKNQGRENLMSDTDIAALLSLSKGKEAEFKKAALGYLKIKEAVLDVAEKAGLIDPTTRATWDHVEYIPFYRADDADPSMGPGTKKALANQPKQIKRLQGGKQNLSDPLGNIVKNFTQLIDASLKNNSMLEAVDQYGTAFFEKQPMSGGFERIPLSQIKQLLLDRGVPQSVIDAMPAGTLSGLQKMWAVKPPDADDVVRVMRDGKPEYYKVPDPDLLLSLTSFKPPTKDWYIKPFIWLKRLLTAGVTASPEFMARNFIRDSGSSWILADDKFRLGWDSAKGVIKPLMDDSDKRAMMFAGGSFIGGQIHGGSPDETAKALRRSLREKGLNSKQIEDHIATIAATPLKLWDKWQAFGSALENANRNAIYENAIKAGRSPKEAAYLARDLMDFAMQGDSRFVQVLADVLPFFNARLQGLYKLYRQGGKKALRKALLMRAGTVTAATVGLLAWNLLMYGDDYDELEEWDKDTYWHIAPGTKNHIRIPKPFELGALFATVPERVAQSILGNDRPGVTAKQIGAQVWGTLAMNPVPQGVMPVAELWANKSFFTGRPIENIGDQNLLPEARAEWYTSDTAQLISGQIGNASGMSPKRLEHLWNGYTGTMGAYALDLTDAIVRQIQDKPDRPELAWAEMPVLKAMYRGDMVPKSTKYTSDFYELLDKANDVSGTIKEYEVSGRKDDAAELEAKWKWLLGDRIKSKQAKAGFMHSSVKEFNKARDRLSAIRKEMEGIIAMTGFSSYEKRAKIDALAVERNALAKKMAQKYREKQ